MKKLLGIEQLKSRGTPAGVIEILKLQFKEIKKDIRKFNFEGDRWYETYYWTEEQQDRFKDKLKSYIKKNRRKFLDTFKFMYYPVNDRTAERCASEAILLWGWATYRKNKDKVK